MYAKMARKSAPASGALLRPGWRRHHPAFCDCPHAHSSAEDDDEEEGEGESDSSMSLEEDEDDEERQAMRQGKRALKRAVPLSGGENEWARAEGTPDRGWRLVAKRAIPQGTLFSAQCNVKLLRRGAGSSSEPWELEGSYHEDKVAAMVGPEEDPEDWTVVLAPLKNQLLRYANLPTPPPQLSLGPDSSESLLRAFVADHHNISYMVLRNRPVVLARVCRAVRAGEELTAHYGRHSVEVLRRSLRAALSD